MSPAPAAAIHHSSRPMLIIIAGVVGVVLAGTLALWAWYGTAVFTEMVLAGLAACF
jgi:hypothetical protein